MLALLCEDTTCYGLQDQRIRIREPQVKAERGSGGEFKAGVPTWMCPELFIVRTLYIKSDQLYNGDGQTVRVTI